MALIQIRVNIVYSQYAALTDNQMSNCRQYWTVIKSAKYFKRWRCQKKRNLLMIPKVNKVVESFYPKTGFIDEIHYT